MSGSTAPGPLTRALSRAYTEVEILFFSLHRANSQRFLVFILFTCVGSEKASV